MLERKLPDKLDAASFGSEQFQELDGLVADIRGSGAKLIFVQQPVEFLERIRSPQYANYMKRMASFTTEHSIGVIDMSDSAGDAEFANPLHGKENVWDLWSRRLASKLRTNSMFARRLTTAQAVGFAKR
jgi:hypothetical protein